MALGFALALFTIGLARADETVSGAWKLSVGVNDAPCTVTLTPDASGDAGVVSSGSDCPGGLNVLATWKTAGRGIQLYSGTGDLVVWLNPKGDDFVGNRISDGRKVALSR